MARLGSDPDQMTELALVLEREANQMRSSASGINSMMRDVRWLGPAHDFFLGWWDSKQYKWIMELADTLDGLGQTVLRQATDQTQASMTQEFGINDPASTRFMYSTTFEGGKKLGVGIESLYEYSINASYYQQRNEDGMLETRGEISVFVAAKIGLDLSDLELVASVATLGGYAAAKKLAGDTLIGSGLNVSGTVSAGIGREYVFNDLSNRETNEMYNHHTAEATNFANRLGNYGVDDLERAIENEELPPPDSVIIWSVFDAEVGVGYSMPLGSDLGVGAAGSLMYGKELFANGGIAEIVRGDLSVYVAADVPVFSLFKDVEFSGMEGEVGVSVERKLIFDDTGRPVSLVITDKVGVELDGSKGLVVSEIRSSENSIVTTYTYDLTDPDVVNQLNVGEGSDLLSLSERALDNVDLAYGESHMLDSDGQAVSFDLLYAVGMNESGEIGWAKQARVKPIGELEFTAREAL